jgi:hypothetical protein
MHRFCAEARFNEGRLVFWTDLYGNDKCSSGPLMDSFRSEGIVIGTLERWVMDDNFEQ